METTKVNEEDEFDIELSEEDIKEFDSRREARLKGETTLYSLEDAKTLIINKTTK